MCELVVRIVDRPSVSKEKDARRSLAGDVIRIEPDGHSWGSGETGNPDWAIVSIPGVKVEAMQEYVRVDNGVDGSVKRFRSTAFKPDFVAKLIADRQVKGQGRLYAAQVAEVNEARLDKPVADVGVIG